MRRTTTLTAFLLGATLLAPTGSATAVGETCRGEAATIVGTGPAIVGTDGRDVIVTGDSIDTSAGAGDDLICVTPGAGLNLRVVDAGAGNDVVDSTTMPGGSLSAVLGDGSDTFVGGVEGAYVVAGAIAGPRDPVPSESERDVIDTGDGPDVVFSGGPGLINDDVVRAGGGEDTVTWSGVMGAEGVLEGGDGVDALVTRASGETFDVDLGAGTITREGLPAATYTAFERVRVAPEADLGSVGIAGTAGPDDVEILAPASLRVELAAGDDSLRLVGMRSGSSIDLGAGTDRIDVASREGSVNLDLKRGRLVVDAIATATIAGIENASVSADRAIVAGDDRANELLVTGCGAAVNGRGGRDWIKHSNYDAQADQGYGCGTAERTLRGGAGNDLIEGGIRADRIYGGPGRDRIETKSAREGVNRAWGGPGNDKIFGGGARDVLAGQAGHDLLRSGPGDDRLRGGKGADRLNGGDDDDTLIGGRGRDRAVGGPGRDRCDAEVRKGCEQ